MRYAVVEEATGIVKNVIVWGGSRWSPPEGHIAIPDERVNIGDIYDKTTQSFSRPR